MKNLIAAMLCLIMIFSTVMSTSALKDNSAAPDIAVGELYTSGDANDDGHINALDAIELKKQCAYISNNCSKGADINCDGKINAKDLLIFKRCVVNLDSFENYKSDKPIYHFEIGGYDLSEFSIVYHPNSKYAENNYYAADTLRKFIEIATDINLSVETNATKTHKIEFVDVTTVSGLEEELEIENYKYEVVNGNLYIYGTYRGALYAVYEILEEYLGYRFYNDTFTYQFAEKYVNIKEDTSVSRSPYLEIRFCEQGFRNEDEAHYYPRRLNGSWHRISTEALGTLTGPQFIDDPSYNYYWRMATGNVYVDYDGTNGDGYYAKYNAGAQINSDVWWRPCYTNDDVYETLFRGLLETIRYVKSWSDTFAEDISIMSFSMPDYNTPCSCAECKYIAYAGTDRKLGARLNCGITGLKLYIANRACDDIKAYYDGRPVATEADGTASNGTTGYGYGQAIYDAYPNIRLYTILDYYTMPHENIFSDEKTAKQPYSYEVIRPRDNLCIVFRGNPCKNHYLGSGGCDDTLDALGNNGQEKAEAFKAWSNVAKETGSAIWLWYSHIEPRSYAIDTPNIFNIWHDFKYAVEECNVTGIYFEGANNGYLFENLKSHLAAEFMWSIVENDDGSVSYMSYDEFISEMKEYLRIHYGDGYEYVYKYICMQDEAGNKRQDNCDYRGNPILDENGEQVYKNVCFVNGEFVGDMFDYEYMNNNYEYMRDLILKGMALVPAENAQMYQRYEFLLMNIETIGLSAVRKSWYISETATDEQKAAYKQRYDWLFNFLADERMNENEGLDSREWNYANDTDEIDDLTRIVVSSQQPYNWMEQLADLDYYHYSPYGLITGDYVDYNGNGKYDIDERFSVGSETLRRLSKDWEFHNFVAWG